MRTGANFARGSCRALKWMAMFGVVFALGAGQAFAQAKAPTLTVTTSGTVTEGANRVPVVVRLQVPAVAAGETRSQNVAVTLTLSVTAVPVITAELMAELGADGDAAWDRNDNADVVLEGRVQRRRQRFLRPNRDGVSEHPRR